MGWGRGRASTGAYFQGPLGVVIPKNQKKFPRNQKKIQNIKIVLESVVNELIEIFFKPLAQSFYVSICLLEEKVHQPSIQIQLPEASVSTIVILVLPIIKKGKHLINLHGIPTTIVTAQQQPQPQQQKNPHLHPHHHTNSKLHDRAELEQNSKNKSY